MSDKTNTPLPAIAAVISTHNRCDDLRLTLNLLQNLGYPALQIIVVDNASTDTSREILTAQQLLICWFSTTIRVRSVVFLKK